MSEPAVDLSLCSQCWAPFDAGEHQPKLLQCPFHPLATVCLQCLKVTAIQTNKAVVDYMVASKTIILISLLPLFKVKERVFE